MHDIRLALGLMAFVSVGVFLLGIRLLRPRSKTFIDIMAVVIVLLMVAYGYLIFGKLWVVKWIPLPSVVVLSNWIPPFLSLLAAAVWLRLEDSAWRRWAVVIILFGGAIYSGFYFIPEEAPQCRNEWTRAHPPVNWPVCRQTTRYTCSAAAAATMLNTVGIETTEQEMAHLCLTRSGTTWLGLYHGLSSKLLDTDYRLDFFECDADELDEQLTDFPVLLCCKLDPDVARIAPDYVNNGGWIPGLAHSVVYFQELGDRHVIGDPSQGFEFWSSLDLNNLWTGVGLRIVPRQ